MTSGYAPDAIDDELLYGTLARRRRHLALLSDAVQSENLFGSRMAVATMDLPARLVAAGYALGIDPEVVALNRTLYPYYVAFQPEEARAAALGIMLAGDEATPHLRLGVATFRIRPPDALRSCPDCLVEMGSSKGEATWLRSHQLPGSVVCHRHGIPLHASAVRPGQAARHQYISPDADELAEAPPITIPDGALPLLQEIARRESALCSTLLPAHDFDHWAPHYRRRLAVAGLMRSPCKVNQVALGHAMRAFFGEALRHLPEPCAKLGPGGWTELMTRSHRKAMHPLLHVMMDIFLAAAPAADPFGPGPWPCRNPLSDHHGDHRITVMDRYRNREAVVGVFRCDCGYSYTRGLAADGTLGRPRLKNAGPMLEPALRRLVDAGGSLRGIARQVGMDPKTLIREAASLGIEVPWRTKASGRTRASRLPAHPVDGDMRKRVATRTPGPRLDWRLIDRNTCDRLRVAAAAIGKLDPPVRVTLGALERRVARLGWIGKRRAKLPASFSLAQRLTESTEAFQRRRTRHFVLRMPGAKSWEIMRAAGLRGCHLPMIEAEATLARSSSRRL